MTNCSAEEAFQIQIEVFQEEVWCCLQRVCSFLLDNSNITHLANFLRVFKFKPSNQDKLCSRPMLSHNSVRYRQSSVDFLWWCPIAIRHHYIGGLLLKTAFVLLLRSAQHGNLEFKSQNLGKYLGNFGAI
jgi:hypothetical protein